MTQTILKTSSTAQSIALIIIWTFNFFFVIDISFSLFLLIFSLNNFSHEYNLIILIISNALEVIFILSSVAFMFSFCNFSSFLP